MAKILGKEGPLFMKKIRFLWLVICALAITNCSKKDVDPYATYRTKSALELFDRSEHALAKQKYQDAVKYLEALDAIYPFSPYTPQAQLDIIYAYYQNNDSDASALAAERYIRLYPRGQYTDYAYYMRGITCFTEGLSWLQKAVGVDPAPRDISNMDKAYRAFADLVQQFPNSPYASDSYLRIRYIRNIIAKREIFIAHFYFKHQAYVAAANRAAGIVQHYQGTPSVIEALAVMVKSYRALQLFGLAKSTLEILKSSYPDSPQYRELRENA